MEDELVGRLRRDNPEQLFILVRMHLSFVVDVNTDEEENNRPRTAAVRWPALSKMLLSKEPSAQGLMKQQQQQEVFSLSEENVARLYRLMEVVGRDENVKQEGVFRRTGSLVRQQLLRKVLMTGNETIEEGFSVHDMASVLKGTLADTPEPLLLHNHYQAYCHLAGTCFSDGQLISACENRLMKALRLLLLLLTASSWHLANRLLSLLNRVASFESHNRMSPLSLATMFAPHVMCPRRISPESLHTDSQMLAPILSFMITNAAELFVTPPELATDIAAYLARREQKRLLSPNGEDLNESISERTAANTVFTFVDRQMSCTGEANNSQSSKNTYNTNFTDTALAQLYAHIQALPESQNKRRLIKQFNRENGHGTPLQIQRAQKQRSIGQSLKKHIFNKSLMSKTIKRSALLQDQGFGYQSIMELQSPTANKTQQRNESGVYIELKELAMNQDTPKRSRSNDVDLQIEEKSSTDTIKVEQTTALVSTPQIIKRKLDIDQLLTSTPQMANRDAVVVVGGYSTPVGNIRRNSMSPITKSTQKMPKSMQESIMTPRSRKPVIINCDTMVTAQPPAIVESLCVSSKSIIADESLSSSMSIKNDSDFVSTDESCPSKSYCIKYKRFGDDVPKKQQLSISHTSCDSSADIICRRVDAKKFDLDQSDSEIIETVLSKRSIEGSKRESLTDPFRNYLLCRSILTKSPVDLSFASNSDDFTDVENLTENKITDSLMFCLDGNRPDASSKDCDRELLLGDESVDNDHNRNLKRSSNEGSSSSFKSVDKENIEPKTKKSTTDTNCESDDTNVTETSKSIDRNKVIQQIFVGGEPLSCEDHWRPLRETNL